MEWIYFVVIVLIYGHEPKSLVGAIEYEIPDFAYIEKRRRNQYGNDEINDNYSWESFNLDDDNQNFQISNETISADIRKKHDSPPYQYGLIDDEPDNSNFQILFYNKILNQSPNRSNFQTLMDRYDQANQPMDLSPIRIPYRKKIDIYNNYLQDGYDDNSIEENTVENNAELDNTNEINVGYNSIQTTEVVELSWEGNKKEGTKNKLANNVTDDKSSKQKPMINSKSNIVAIDNTQPILENSNSKNQSSLTRFNDESCNINKLIGKGEANEMLHSYEINYSPQTNVSQTNGHYRIQDNKLDRTDSSLVLKGQMSTNVKQLNTRDLENQIESNQKWIDIKSHPIRKQVRGNFINRPQINIRELDEINQESDKVIVNRPLCGRFLENFKHPKLYTHSQKSSKNVSKSSDNKENIVCNNKSGKLLANKSNNEPLIIQNTNNVDQKENNLLQSSRKAMKSKVKGPGYREKMQKVTQKEIKNINLQKTKDPRMSSIGYMNSTSNKNITKSKSVHKYNPRHPVYNYLQGKINQLNNLIPHYRKGPRRENFISNLMTENNSTFKRKLDDLQDVVNYNGPLDTQSKLFLENNSTYTQDKIECLKSKEKDESENIMKISISKNNVSKLIDKGNPITFNSTLDNNLQMPTEQESSKTELCSLTTNRTINNKTNSINTQNGGRSESQIIASNGTLHNLSKSFSRRVKSSSKLKKNSQSSFIKENLNPIMKSKLHSSMKRENSQQIYYEPRKFHSWLNQINKRSMQKCTKPLVKKKVQVGKKLNDAFHVKKFKETITNINSEIQSDMNNNKNIEDDKDKFSGNGRVKRRMHWSFKIKNEENETPRKEKVKEIELKVDSKRCKGCSLKQTSIEMTLKKEPTSSMSEQQKNGFKDDSVELGPFPIKINKINPKLSFMAVSNKSDLLAPNSLKQTDGISNTSFPKQLCCICKDDKIGNLSNSILHTNKSNNVNKISVISPSTFCMNEPIEINKITNLSSSAPLINEDKTYLSTALDKTTSDKGNKINNTSSCAAHEGFNERNPTTNLSCSLHLQELNEINQIANLSSKPQQNKLNNYNKTNTIFCPELHSNEWNGDKDCNMSFTEDHRNECKTDRENCELSYMYPCIGGMQTKEFPHLLNKWDGWYRWYGCPHLSQILAENLQENTALNIDNPELLPNATANSPKRKGVTTKTVSNKKEEPTENKWSLKHFGICKEKGSTILPTLPIIEPVMHSNISLFTGNVSGDKEFRFLDNSSSLLLQNVGKLLSFYNDKTCKQSLRNELEPLRNSLKEIFKNLGSQEGLSMLNPNTAHIEHSPVSNSPAINTFNHENQHTMIETLLSNLRNFNKNSNSKRIKRYCNETEKEKILHLNSLNREDKWQRLKYDMGSPIQAEVGTQSKGSIRIERNITLVQAHSNLTTPTFKNVIKSAIINDQNKNNLKIENKLNNHYETLEFHKREKRSTCSLDLSKNHDDNKEPDIIPKHSDQFQTDNKQLNGVSKKQLIKTNKQNVIPEKIAVVNPIFFSEGVIMMNLTPRPMETDEPNTKALEHLNLIKTENETLSNIRRIKDDKLKQLNSNMISIESDQRNSGRLMKIEFKKRKSPSKRPHHLQMEKCHSDPQVTDAIIREEINEEINDIENQISGNILTSERQWIGKDTQFSDDTDKLEETSHHHRNIYSIRKKKKKFRSNIAEDHMEPVQIGEPIITRDREKEEELNTLNTDQFSTETFSTSYTSTEDTIKLKGGLELKALPTNLLAKEQQKIRPNKFEKIPDASNNISRNCLIQDIDELLLVHDSPHSKKTWLNSAVDTLLKEKLHQLNCNFEKQKIPLTSTIAYFNDIDSSQKNERMSEQREAAHPSTLIPHMEAQPGVNRQSEKSTIYTRLGKTQSLQSNSDSKLYDSVTYLRPKKYQNYKNKVNLYADNPLIDLDHEEIQEGKHSLHQSSETKLHKQTPQNKRRPNLRKASRKSSISQISLPKQTQDKTDEINEDNMNECFSEANDKKDYSRFEERKDAEEDYVSTLEEKIGLQKHTKYSDDEEAEREVLEKESDDRDHPDMDNQNRKEHIEKQLQMMPLKKFSCSGTEDTNHNIQDLVKNSNAPNREPHQFNRAEIKTIKLQHSPWKNKKNSPSGNARSKHKKKNNLNKSERDDTRSSSRGTKKFDRVNNKYFQNKIKDLAIGNKESTEMDRKSGYDYDEDTDLKAPKSIKAHSKLNCKANKKMGKKKKERAPRKSKGSKSKNLKGPKVSKNTKEFDQTVDENNFNINDEEYIFETNEGNSNINGSNDADLTSINMKTNSPMPNIPLGENEVQENDEVEMSRDEEEGDEINKPLESNSEIKELDNENPEELENNVQPSLQEENQFISKELNNDWISAEKGQFKQNGTDQEWGKKNDNQALNDVNKEEQTGFTMEKKTAPDNEEKRINMILEGIANRYKTNSGEQSKNNLKSGFNLKLKNLLSPGIKAIGEEEMPKYKKKHPKQQNTGPFKQNKILKKRIKKKNKSPGKRDMPGISLLSIYNTSNVNKPKNNNWFRKHIKEPKHMYNSQVGKTKNLKIESNQKQCGHCRQNIFNPGNNAQLSKQLPEVNQTMDNQDKLFR